MSSHYEKLDGIERCIDDEIPFEISENWSWIRLSQLTTKIGAGSPPTGGRAVYLSEGVKFIRSQNVYNDGLRLNDIAYISDETNKKKSGSIVCPKDILLNITGGSIGRCAIVPDDFDVANVNQHVKIMRETCERKEVEIIEVEYCPDHIHMLVVISPRLSVSRLWGN